MCFLIFASSPTPPRPMCPTCTLSIISLWRITLKENCLSLSQGYLLSLAPWLVERLCARPLFMLGHVLAQAFTGLVHAIATGLGTYVQLSCHVWKTYCLWLLGSFCPLFDNDPWDLEEEVWCRCLIYGWVSPISIFSALPSHRSFLMRVDNCTNLRVLQ